MPNFTSRFRRTIRRQKKRVGEDDLRRIVRENIRGRRLLLGMSQARLGKRIGVSQPWIMQIEDMDDKDQASPDLKMLRALANALRTTPIKLLTDGKYAKGLSIVLPRGILGKLLNEDRRRPT